MSDETELAEICKCGAKVGDKHKYPLCPGMWDDAEVEMRKVKLQEQSNG